MGGEPGGTEGGAPPPTIDNKDVRLKASKEPSKDKPVRTEEQKKTEKEQKKFDEKVAILADQLWQLDVKKKGKDSHPYYRDLAEKMMRKRIEVNARRRKKGEDKKKREEPIPKPDVPNIPPDQSGEETAGTEASTEEIAGSEGYTQQHEVKQPSTPEQQEELAREYLYLEDIRGELNKLDKDKKNVVDEQPTPKLEDQRKQEKTDGEEVGRKEQKPVSDEELFLKIIESTAKGLGIKPGDVPLALVKKMKERFLARQAAK